MSRTLPTIVHLDADAFFVSVEQVLNPSLRGKKVAVGGRDRGIISSASYEARACGVYTPMPTSQALRVCPGLILISGGHGRYAEFSKKLFDICESVTPFVERRSIDEGFLDLKYCGFKTTQEVETSMRALQARIMRELGISVTFGLATNKLVAAIASKQNKPRGFTLVPPGDEQKFLAPLPASVIPGVGKKTEVLLKANGIERVSDFLIHPPEKLRTLLGSACPGFLAAARGEDDSEVVTECDEAKSYSRQETFSKDISDFPEIVRITKGMIDELMACIRADGKRVRTLTVKVRYPGMEDESAGRSLREATDLEAPFYPLVEELLRTAWRQRRRPLRLAAVRFSGIGEESPMLDLFAGDEERKRKLAGVADALNLKTGGGIKHGHQVKRPSA